MHVYLGFAALAALLLWAVIYGRGPWQLKLALILTVPAYGIFVWHSVEAMRGYPVRAKPPEGKLIASVVVEPKYVYLWLAVPGKTEPRAYRIPYTRQVHQALAGASQSAQRQGRVGIRMNRGRYVVYALPMELPTKEGE